MKGNRRHTAAKRRREVFRKKLLLCLTAVVIIAGLSVGLGSNFASAQDDTEHPVNGQRYYKSIVLESGDTLWDIAEEFHLSERETVSEYVEDLMVLNNLDTDMIHEGQFLTVIYYEDEM